MRSFDSYRDIKERGGNCRYLILDYKRPFFEPLMRESRIRFNQTTQVCDVYYNVQNEEHFNPVKTQKKVNRALKKLFGVEKSICVVNNPLKSSSADTFCMSVEFYFKKDCPDLETALKVPALIEENCVPSEFLKTDITTGEQTVYKYSELPGSKTKVRKIARFCISPFLDECGKTPIIDNGHWEYLK